MLGYSIRNGQPTKCQFYREKQKVGSVLNVANAWIVRISPTSLGYS